MLQIEEHATLKKWGAGGLCLSINATMRKLLNLEEGTPVNIQITEKGFFVEPMREEGGEKSPYTLEQLLVDITPENAHAELLVEPLDNEWPNYK